MKSIGGLNMGMEIERVTYTVDEASKLLGLSRNSAYEGVARGDIPSMRIGRRLLVPRAALERLLAASPGPVDRVEG